MFQICFRVVSNINSNPTVQSQEVISKARPLEATEKWVDFGELRYWLVLWNLEHYSVFHRLNHIGNFIILNDQLIFFRGVETTSQLRIELEYDDVTILGI